MTHRGALPLGILLAFAWAWPAGRLEAAQTELDPTARLSKAGQEARAPRKNAHPGSPRTQGARVRPERLRAQRSPGLGENRPWPRCFPVPEGA